MAKLTRNQVRDLERVIYDARAAYSYIRKDSTVIAFKKLSQSTTADYLNKAGEVLSVVEKECGFELIQLPSAIKRLQNFIQENRQ